MLAGSPAMAIRSSLLAVNRTCAGASDPFASLTGVAPSGPILVTKVTPRSETLQLITRSTRWAWRSASSISAIRPVRFSSAWRHSSAVAMKHLISPCRLYRQGGPNPRYAAAVG